MSAEILPFIQSDRQGEAEREARAFVVGRHQVTSQELADHFSRRGWALGPRRAGHMLLQMGWSSSVVPDGDRALRLYTRPSPIADGSWRRPWLEPAQDPARIASAERWARWNRAFGIFAALAFIWIIAMAAKAWL